MNWTSRSECRTLSRKPHYRRTNDRRQKTAVFLIAGHFAKYALLDKSSQIDLFRQPHLFNFCSTDVVHISEDIIVIMNLCLWICFKNFLLSLPWRFSDGVFLNEGAQANSSDVISLMNFHIFGLLCPTSCRNLLLKPTAVLFLNPCLLLPMLYANHSTGSTMCRQ